LGRAAARYKLVQTVQEEAVPTKELRAGEADAASETPAPEDVEARRDAYRRPFECDLPGTPEEFADLVVEAERRGWPEVVRAGLYGQLRHAAEPGGEAPREIARLLERAESDGDRDMVALALAWRAWVAIVRRGEMGGQADDDLARAAVLLESEGDPVVKAAAHFRVAFSYWHRRLWELADEQFAATEAMVHAVDPFAKDPLLHRAALAFDRVMVQVDLACAAREIGDLAAAQERKEAQVALIAAAECLAMPSEWRDHIRVAALVVDVLAGAARLADVDEELAELPEREWLAEWEGHLYLARSLHPHLLGNEVAAQAAERAVEVLAASNSADAVYFMALHQAAELEASAAGRITAGLRSAQALAAQREAGRLASLAGMRATLASERMRAERDALLSHAYTDPLTGLANRRGFERHVDALVGSESGQVALLLFDLDNLKPLNDRFGHAAGDEVLCWLAEVLRAKARPGDCAARFGGDEFVLLIAGAGPDVASRRAQEITGEVAGKDWAEIGPGLQVSVSAGYATGHPSDINRLMTVADAALFDQKAGRRAAPDLSAAVATRPQA
jgi:diguanylate cyclase (GGDEF)-like protein